MKKNCFITFLDIFKMFFKDKFQTAYKNVLFMLNIDGYKKHTGK